MSNKNILTTTIFLFLAQTSMVHSIFNIIQQNV